MMMLVTHYRSIFFLAFFFLFLSSSCRLFLCVSICIHTAQGFLWPAATFILQPINNKQRRSLPFSSLLFFHRACVKQKKKRYDNEMMMMMMMAVLGLLFCCDYTMSFYSYRCSSVCVCGGV
jgi:hypothetical protein